MAAVAAPQSGVARILAELEQLPEVAVSPLGQALRPVFQVAPRPPLPSERQMEARSSSRR